nr:Fic family protein [Sphingomonas sp.]
MTYIHELGAWPDLRWNLNMLAARLAGVRHSQGRLLGRMESLGFQLRSEAVLETLTADVLKSSEIEGEHLNLDQVRSSIARRLGMDVVGLVPADRDVEGVVDMMLDATQRYAEPLTEERLLSWHAALFPTGRSGLNKIVVGTWREDAGGPMQVVSGPFGREKIHFEAPAAGLIPAEMASFLAWFEADQGIDQVLKAGIAHLWFVTIHPFEDGNGRIARAITDMALARSENSAQRFYSMSAQIRTERADYYHMLERTQKSDLDITTWLDWFLDCLARAIAQADQLLGGVLEKAHFWEKHAQVVMNDRQRKVLNRVLNGFEGKLTSSKWAKLTKASQDTASRDIVDLVKKGVLVRDEAGGRSTSYSLVKADPA